MTKEITKAIILQEMEDKLKLREFAPSKFLFDETVVPVYEIHQHLQKWRSVRYVVSITSAAPFLIHNIPDNERWTLRAYALVFFSGVYTVAGVYILRNLGNPATDFSYLDLTAAQSTSYLRTLPEPVILEPGDGIKVNVDGWTSIGNLYIYCDYMVEEIR